MSTELAKPAASLMARPTDDMVPDFIREDNGPLGTETLSKYVVPPRMKVIQDKRDEQYKQFEPGSAILTPVNIHVVSNNEPFYVVPLLFFPEYLLCNPFALRSSLPFIRDRTLNVASEIAHKARTKELRDSEPCPENPKYTLRYVEVLNYICVLVGHPELSGTQFLMSFSKGEYGKGLTFSTLIKMRGKLQLYACVFECVIPKVPRNKDGNTWYGIDVSNPTTAGCPHPVVQNKEDFLLFKDQHIMLADKLSKELIRPDYDEEVVDAEKEAAVAAAEKQF